jgi:hypothetical protein
LLLLLSCGRHNITPQPPHRQGVPNSKWRLTDVNKDYAYCESYPSLLAVPAGISDEELKEVFAFRSKGRMPVVCYRHTNNVAIARCSQPLAGTVPCILAKGR